METSVTKESKKRNQAPLKLAVQFLKDYKEVIQNHSLEQQIEITEHLIGMVELMSGYLQKDDESLYGECLKRASELMKKYGVAAQSFYEKNFTQYFYYENALGLATNAIIHGAAVA